MRSEDRANVSARQETEVVYVCSPDWQHYLFTSLRSLLFSGSSFDRIVIYCVGKRPRSWRFQDSRITVEEVAPIVDGYFLSSKVYLTQRESNRVVFLDADTMVLKPLDLLYSNVPADFLGRVAGQYHSVNWNQQKWDDALRLVDAAPTPYFNCGLTIFQNGSQRRIRELWPDFIRRSLAGELVDLAPRRFTEQISLSLAIGAAGLSHHMLDETEHAYGWRNEPYEGAVVFHTSGPHFLPMATTIERELGIANLDLPKFSGAIPFNRITLHRRFRHLTARVRNLAAGRER